MNPHRPENWKEWGQLEFIGLRFTSGPYTWMRARHKSLKEVLYFCFEKNCAVFQNAFEHYRKDVDANTNFR